MAGIVMYQVNSIINNKRSMISCRAEGRLATRLYRVQLSITGCGPYAVTPWIPEVTRPDYRDKPTVMYATLEREMGGGGWEDGWKS